MWDSRRGQIADRTHECDIKLSDFYRTKTDPISSMNILFDNTYAQLPERFFAKQESARVPEPKLIRLNLEARGKALARRRLAEIT